MINSTNGSATLDYLAEILIRCFWYSVVLLAVSLLTFMVAGDAAFQAHSMMFGISKHEFVLMYYYGTAFLKIIIFIFFLIPWIAIRVVLKKHKRSDG
ncbi:MAG: hypothetical protein GXO70_05050 [Acidobacteria bacterium]|nr:hypothetical protein [Acidobacteriota bacterium]